MRIRSIKPDFFKDDELAALPPLARLLFVGLWCMADCEGRLDDRPPRIRAEVLPYDECDVDALLDTLHAAEFIVRYLVGSRSYIEVRSFKKHQRLSGVEAAKESELPSPDHPEAIEKQSRSITEAIEKQPMHRKGREGNGRERKGTVSAFAAPSVEELSSYLKEIGATFSAQSFIDHYEERGWRWGAGYGHPMKDWRRCARKWNENNKRQPPFAPRQSRPAPALIGAHKQERPTRDIGDAPDDIREIHARLRRREASDEEVARLDAWVHGGAG